MNFLALIIALLLRQMWGASARLQQDDWLWRWQAQVSTWHIGAWGRLAVIVLLPTVLARWALSAAQPLWFGLPWIALAVILFLYALGRGDFQQLMERYRSQCRDADFEGAYLAAQAEAAASGAMANPQSPQEVHDFVQRGVFYEGYQRWFPVTFYFVLLGPAGALAYRVLQLCRDNFEPEVAERWIFLADWLPARLLAATFMLTGDFTASRDALYFRLGDIAAAPGQILFEVGTAALATPPPTAPDEPSFCAFAARQNEDTGKLLSRSAICWVAIISLLVILG